MKRVLQLIIVLVFCTVCLCSRSYAYASSCSKYYCNSTSKEYRSIAGTYNSENKQYNIDNSDNVVINDNKYYISDYSSEKSDVQSTSSKKSAEFGIDFKFRVQDFLVFDILIKTKKKNNKK